MVGKMVVEDLDTEARQNFGTRKSVQAFLSVFQRDFARAFARAMLNYMQAQDLRAGLNLFARHSSLVDLNFFKFEILGVEKKEEAENQSNPKPMDISSCVMR